MTAAQSTLGRKSEDFFLLILRFRDPDFRFAPDSELGYYRTSKVPCHTKDSIRLVFLSDDVWIVSWWIMRVILDHDDMR